MRKVERERIERAARIYASNEDACRALGIAAGSFSRLCRLYGIETPYARKRRRWKEARQRSVSDAVEDILELGLDLDLDEVVAVEREMSLMRRKAS